MRERRQVRPIHGWKVVLLLAGLVSGIAAAQGMSPTAALDQAMSAAEASLQAGDFATAETRYGEALREGWLLMGTLERLEGRRPQAQAAYRNALPFAGEERAARRALAFSLLRVGAPAEATRILEKLTEEDPADADSLRLLAMALAADGQIEAAGQRLDAASAVVSGDPQQVFLLATEYLWLKRFDAAAGLFARVLEERPIPQTHVLIGRAWRDAGEYERARAELRAALDKDPAVRRAHYYLGMVMLAEQSTDPAQMEKAEAEFRQELEIEPQDPLANDQLGVVLLDAGRPEEALPFLETAARAEERSRHYLHLGRCQLSLDQVAEGVASSRRALELARKEGADTEELERIHYQLGRALRMHGERDDAEHLAEAARLRGLRRDAADAEEASARSEALWPFSGASPLADLTPEQRTGVRDRVTAGLARAYFNLGVLEAQSQETADAAERFARAASFFQRAADVDPDFPQVQSSLGVAWFNARRFEEAAEPLARALEADPTNAGLRRMLALSSLNTFAWERAARLLRDDPDLAGDPSLQSAYALALVRSRRGAEAEAVLTRLLSQQGESAELRVLLGQALAQQEKHEAAVAALQRALELDPAVAEAHRTLGVAYLRQGRLAEAEEALRAELKAFPSDTRSQLHLTAVLDAQGRPDEAVAVVRGVLEAEPESAEALYLLGRILLAQGEATEAVEHLERAARLAPDDANVRSQLGQAYQTLGRADLARQELEASRQLGGEQQ